MRLQLTTTQHDELRGYLLGDTETAAFLYAAEHDDVLRVEEVQLLEPQDYLAATQHGLTSSDSVRPAVIRKAHAQQHALVEAHAHHRPGRATRFSRTDLEGLDALGPHMTWRLPQHPYTALVLGPDSFDALQWHTGGHVTVPEALIVGSQPRYPTGLSAPLLAQIRTSA
jgi:hypothetical protein